MLCVRLIGGIFPVEKYVIFYVITVQGSKYEAEDIDVVVVVVVNVDVVIYNS